MTEAVRSIELDCSETVSLSLVHYRAGGRQPRHSHVYTQVSFLLVGDMRELHGESEWAPACHAVGRKPAGMEHENRWGADGALIFSVKMRGGELEAGEAAQPTGWAPGRVGTLLPLLVRHAVSGEPRERLDAVEDLLALARTPTRLPRSAPGWLKTVREALRDEARPPTVSEVARIAGVHRAHLTSLFTRHFGTPPSVYRRNVMAARAISRLIRTSDPATAIAHDAGFSDQAHMSRSLKALCGSGPAELRRWLS